MSAQAEFRERNVDVDGVSIHVAEAGDRGTPAVLFLHGWPENWEAFREVMLDMSGRAHVVAIDLPGIGDSRHAPKANDKRTLAACVRALVHRLELLHVTLVGHDVGGQIVYAYLKAYPAELAGAVIMNVVVPGVDPWSEIQRNPRIWHFGFHSVPELPETLVSGRESAYFAYFYDTLAASPRAVPEAKRARYVQAYSRPEALAVGFDWYRAFEKDARDNATSPANQVHTPVLYVRGDQESGSIDRYAAGLRDRGLVNLSTCVIPNSGHFAPDENPAAVAAAISEFAAAARPR
jgi:pimeloyl-ACP methyl ester carboxylesterase